MLDEYGESFYLNQAGGSKRSAEIILGVLFQYFSPRSMIDLGCGLGTWLEAAKKYGVESIRGIDGSKIDKNYYRVSPELIDSQELPLDNHIIYGEYDLAISLETAEHLKPEKSRKLVQNLVGLSDVVLFSAAIPYQGGTGHQNENWLEYWTNLFINEGYITLDFLRRKVWDDNRIEIWYRQNILIFCSPEAHQQHFHMFEQANAKGLSLIHPEFYLNCVHRFPETRFTHNLEFDKRYYYSSKSWDTGSEPGYGSEFDFDPESRIVTSLESLKHAPISDLKATLIDAVFTDENAVPAEKNGYHYFPGRYKETIPDFLVIGVQKAATTWLYHMFVSHPEIWIPPLKELHYFDEIYLPSVAMWATRERKSQAVLQLQNYLKNQSDYNHDYLNALIHLCREKTNDSWYKRIFGHKGERMLAGEITPEYSLLPDAGIAHIRKMAPDVKIILILRDPVDRAISHIAMVKKQNKLEKEIILALGESSTSIFRRGQYEIIIEKWKKHFKPNTMMIEFYEDIAREHKLFLERLANFLGVDAKKYTEANIKRKVHSSEEMPEEADMRALLKGRYQRTYDYIAEHFPEHVELWSNK